MATCVLIVDDNHDNLCLLESVLKAYDYEVTMAENGKDALAKARFNPPDLIVSDILMPVMDGYALCHLWKSDETIKQIPFVFYTATYTDPKDEAFALSLGAERFVLKPQEPGKLIKIIKEVLEENHQAKQVAAHPLGEEMEFLRQHNESLFKKLEKKMQDLDAANQELRKLEETYLLTFEQVSDIIFTIDTDYMILSISPGLEKILSYKPQDFIGQPVSNFRHIFIPESFERAIVDLRLIIKSETISPQIYELIAKDGTIKYVENNGSPIMRNGKIAGMVAVARDITERKKSEQALRDSYRRLDDIIDFLPYATFVIDRNGNVITWNRSIERMTGISKADIIGKGNYEYAIPFYGQRRPILIDLALLPDEDFENNYYEKAFWQGDSLSAEAHVPQLHKGQGAFLWGTASRLRDASGNIIGAIESINDITERKKAEESLQESEKRLRGITTNMPGVVFQFYAKINGEYGISYVSERMADLFEVPPDTRLDALFPKFISHIHEEDRDRFAASIQNAVEANEPWDFEGRGFKPSGKMMWFHATSIPTRLEDRLVFDGILLDITERKQAEEALRESEELYTQLVDTIPEVVVRTDIDGKILFVNEYTLLRGGYSLAEIEGRNILEFIPPAEHANAIQNIMKIMEEGKQNPHEYHLIMKDGMIIPFEMSSDVFRSKNGTPCGYVHVCRDISQRKQDEEEKEHLQERLNQSQKMESVGRLAGGVAHDFNNMLGVILGHTELAMDKIGPDQPLYANLREIRKAAERSANLTRQLLAFARKQTVSPKVIDMNETVVGMLKMLQRLIGEDIHLAWLPGVNPWPVRIDPSQVDQIMANLCVNARDAIAEVGKVTIESVNISFDEAFCTDHPDFSPGDYVLLSVSDDGCGMDKEIRDKLFEPFFTTKEIGKGTGLGLATIYGIVRQNNGFINIYSELGQGTTVRIYLPRHIGKAEQTTVEEIQETFIRGHETVLIVEDELAILDLSRIMLEQQGYQVLSAATPGEAIKLAKEHHGEIHLLITDVVMPEMNGRDLAKKILSLYPDMKRLFMSGYTADVIAHQGVLDEGVSFIQKPFSRNDLIDKVREVLDQQ